MKKQLFSISINLQTRFLCINNILLGPWTMLIDKPLIKVNVLIIDGTLRFDNKLDKYRIEAK